jgi:hypothetical protein
MTPSTEWREVIPEGEEAAHEALAKQLGELQANRHKGSARMARALHAKAHAAFRANLSIAADLPAYARQGLFARPAQYKAYVRLSNASGDRAHDRVADARGFAVKVLGVEGEKVLGTASTQDFLALDAKSSPFRNAREFVALAHATASGRLLGTLVRELGLRRTISLLLSAAPTVKGRPNDLLDVTFNTLLPIAFGPYAARLQFVPRHSPSPRRSAGGEEDYVRQRVEERAANESLRWEVQAQFFTGAETPIENPTVDWPSSYVRIGELATLPSAPSAEGQALYAFVDQLSFDPWHALVAHRPLGELMRARKKAYFVSTKARHASPEPDGQEWARFGPAEASPRVHAAQ